MTNRPGEAQSSNRSTHFRACTLCEAICGLEIRLEDDRIISIRGDADDPLSRGHICPKAVALQDLHNDPDRLKRPLRRTPSGFEEISWDEAFDEAATRIRAIRDRYGRQALASYAGNPNVHNSGAILFGPALTKAMAPRNRYTATSVDQLPHHLAAYFMFGHQLLLPIPDIDHTDFMLILGANPVVSNGSLMTVPDIKKRLKAINARGGRVIVVDPRRTETALLAGDHLFIQPGTDALLLASLVHTVFDEELANPGRLTGFTDGIDQVQGLVQSFSPESVSGKTGIAAGDIRKLARDFCASPSAVAYGRMGVSVQEFGGLCQWLINVLNIITGNLDRAGGAMFTRPAIDLLKFSGRGGYGRFFSKVRGLPEFGGELPVATMAEDMLADGEEKIRALLTVAGNPVLSTPNGAQLDRALSGLDYMLSIDFYVNETTRHADLILPPTATLEHDHYDLAFHLLAVRNTTRYSPALFDPAPDARHDWEIFLELARRLQDGSFFGKIKRRITHGWMGMKRPAGLLDHMLRKGPYGKTLRLKKLKNASHGIDLGPLSASLPERLFTRNKRINLTPDVITADLQRLNQSLGHAKDPDGGLVLIGRRQIRSNNSWMHNYHRLVKGKERCTLLIHPHDASHLGLQSGDTVVVRSRVGEVRAPIQIDEDMMVGVVSLPHGWGHDRPGVQLQTARQHAGVSMNDLTDENCVDELSGNAVLSGVPVEIVRVEERISDAVG
jgi:anaerobic selenocysteine-containing dehydrogenase